MQVLTAKTIEAKSPTQTKMLFWFLFAGTRGASNRIRIVSLLRKTPNNANQLSTELRIDYKLTLHHLKILERENLVTKIGSIMRYVAQSVRFALKVFENL